MKWYLAVLKKYAVFSGRAGRREFWMFVLFHTIILLLLGMLNLVLGLEILFTIPVIPFVYGTAVLIPGLAVVVRRLHDTGRSGLLLFWGLPGLGITWILRGLYDIYRTVSPAWGLIPSGIFFVIITVFTLRKGMVGKNQYGPDPKARA